MDSEMLTEDVAPGPSTKESDEASTSSDNSDDDDDDDGYDIDSVDGEEKREKSTRRFARRFQTKLNPNLKGLMGEANLRYARGDIETAKKMCFEVMRQSPDAYEPYLTLAQIYENNDLTKYEGFLSIASCLHSHDANLWCRLADLHIQNNKYKEAILCYSRALRTNPKNIKLHQKRLELAELLGDTRFALACKRNMAKKLPRKQHEKIIELCKEVTKIYHEEKNYPKALETLEIPFKRIPKYVTQDLVNMMLELLLLTNKFAQCLDIFIQYCNFTFEIIVDTSNKILVNSYEMPPNIQIDLKVKFMICLIKMECLQLVKSLIDLMICEENVEEIGDLFLDIAEELMATHQYQEALKFLVPLVKSNTYSLAAVWLKYADCLFNCDMLEQAVEAYFTVMTMAPQHVEVLYPLAKSLLKMNKKSEALDVLSQDLSTNKIDVAVLIERMKLLKEINDYDEYFKCAELLLSRHCVIIKYPEEIKIVMTYRTINEKLKRIRKMRNFRGDTARIQTNYESIREPNLDVEYQLYKDILQFCKDHREYSQMEKFAFMGLTSKKFTTQFKDILLAALNACIYNNDTFHGYSLIRDLVFHNKFNNLAWNLFNILLQTADEVRHNRFILRFQERLPNFDCLQVIEANYGLSIGTYNIAMKFYMNEFRKNPSPYISFILGIILLQRYSKRKNNTEDKRKLTEIITSLFIYYANNRSKDAECETFYNLGRMYQQLGIMYLAEIHYLKALEMCIDDNDDDILSLRYESAYNLHLIYKNSGNRIAARNILIKYLTI